MVEPYITSQKDASFVEPPLSLNRLGQITRFGARLHGFGFNKPLIHVADRQSGETGQQRLLGRRQWRSRLTIDDAQRAERVAQRRDKWGARIEPDARIPLDQGIV